jgi:hypothetical protein
LGLCGIERAQLAQRLDHDGEHARGPLALIGLLIKEQAGLDVLDLLFGHAPEAVHQRLARALARRASRDAPRQRRKAIARAVRPAVETVIDDMAAHPELRHDRRDRFAGGVFLACLHELQRRDGGHAPLPSRSGWHGTRERARARHLVRGGRVGLKSQLWSVRLS